MDRGVAPEEVRNLRVPAKSLKRLRKTVTTLDLEERLHAARRSIRVAPIWSWLARCCSTRCSASSRPSDITLCDLALREGLVLDYVHRHRKDIARVDRYPDVRRRSAIELGERCHWEADHSRQVAAHGAGHLRPDQGAARPRRSRAGVAGVRVAAARHRQPHQLRAASPPLALPDQERRPARLRADRDRGHRRWWRAITAAARPNATTKATATCRRLCGRRCACWPRSCAWPKRSTAAATGWSGRSTLRDRGEDLRLQVEAMGDAELEVWAGRPPARRAREGAGQADHAGQAPA